MHQVANHLASADNHRDQRQSAPAEIHHSDIDDTIEEDGDFDDTPTDDDVLDTTLASDNIEESPLTKSLANRSHTQTTSQPILAGTKLFSRPVDDHHHGQIHNNNITDQFNFAPRNMKLPMMALQRQTPLSVETPTQHGDHAYGHKLSPSYPSISTTQEQATASFQHDTAQPNVSAIISHEIQAYQETRDTSPSSAMSGTVHADVPCQPSRCSLSSQAQGSESHSGTLQEEEDPGHPLLESDNGHASIQEEESEHSTDATAVTQMAAARIQMPPPATPRVATVDLTSPTYTGRRQAPRNGQSSRRRPTRAGGPPIHGSRIMKTPMRNPARHCHQRPQLMSPVFDEPRQPTEEDLLYLLMARARHKDEELHRAGQLEEEKERLRVQNQAANANLQRALSLHTESEAQNNTLTQNLTAFKEKYYKLKKWALEANEDCERLSNTTSGLKKSLAEVVRDRDELVSQVYHLRSSSAKATEQMGTLRSHVAIVKSEVQKQSDALSQLYGQYVEQRNHLTDEKNRCRKLDTHILFLEQENSTRSKRSNLELESLTTRFEEISKKLLQLVRVTEDSQTMNEESFRTGSNILQSIADKDLTTNADLQPIRKALGTVNSTIEAAPKFIIDRFQESISTLQKGWQAKASAEASNLLSVTQSGNADLVEAQMQVARLQERAIQYEGILELLTQARNAAEERENQERTENRKTLDELRAFGDSKELKKQITVFQNQAGEFSTRYFAANSALEISNQELDKQQQDIQDLRMTLAKAEQERDSLRNAAAEAEEDLRRCNKQIDKQTKRSNSLEIEIRNLQSGRDKAHKMSQEAIEQLERDKSKLKNTLETVEAEKKTIALERDTMQSRIASLRGEILDASDTARKLAETTAMLEAAKAECEKLKNLQSQFDTLKHVSNTQQVEINIKKMDVATLRDQISELRRTNTNLEGDVQRSQNLAKDIDSLETELLNVRKQLKRKAIVEAEKERLESELAVTKNQASKADSLQQENKQLNQTITSISRDLANARKEGVQVASLNQTIADKDESLAILTKQLEDATIQVNENVKNKIVLQHKDEQIAALQQEKSNLEQEQSALQQEKFNVEQEKSALQQQLMKCEGELSNALLDHEVRQSNPQRRVADRSGKGASAVKHSAFHEQVERVEGAEYLEDGILGTQRDPTPQPTGSTTIVPETQFDQQLEAQGGQNSLLLGEDLLNEDSSDLTSLPEESDHGDDEFDPDQELFGAQSTQQSQRTQPEEGQSDGHRQVLQRAPSSVYSSQSEQMLLDQVAQDEARSMSGTFMRPTASNLGLDTVQEETSMQEPQSKILPRNRGNLDTGLGARRLRSESRARGRESTPFPEPSPEPRLNRESTPFVARERYQPNSAAKRRIERDDTSAASEGVSKRFKRTPANLEVKVPNTPSAKTRSGDQTPSTRLKTSLRQGSSVVGTNAPAPGKNQRNPKSQRKGSRQDKYANRFAAET
ncbi:hypothetical protein LTR67_004864 [Exophiala xenobiotica]